MAARVVPRRPSYVRELRHDFRLYYHVSYDDVPTDEAVDLAVSLPEGSAYMAALDPHKAWDIAQKTRAELLDTLWKFLNMKSDARTTEGAPRMRRPWDAWDAQAARAAAEEARRRAHEARVRMEGTRWEDVDV